MRAARFEVPLGAWVLAPATVEAAVTVQKTYPAVEGNAPQIIVAD